MPESGIVLVTGADGSIGRAVVAELCKTNEWVVIGSSRSKVFIQRNGEQTVSEGIDWATVDDLASIGSWIDKIPELPVHVVNCVGHFPGYVGIVDLALSDVRAAFDSNFTAAYNLARLMLPVMRDRSGGQLLLFTSHSRYQAFPKMAAFECSKAAVEQLVKQIANEHSRDGICANAIALATVSTESELAMKPFGDHANWLLPEEIAAVVRRILVDDQRLLNGTILDLFRHSDTYFSQSYFDRIREKNDTD